MKLSIIIVSYNEIEYLREAIESCLNQNVDFDYEIIIGDDGSTDGSINAIKKYVEEYPNLIKYYVMNRNDDSEIISSIRVSKLIKKGLSYVKGQYIIMMSADDIILGKNRLKHQIDFLDLNKEYCACYTDYQLFWENGKEKNIVIKKSYSREAFWAVYYVHLSCFLFRKEVLRNMLDVFCDDSGFVFSILKSGKAAHINEIGFGYRQREKSIMHEVDKMEKSLCEMLLYQDVLNSGGLYTSSLAHFAKPLMYIRNNRNKISDSKYKKYVGFARGKKNNIIELLRRSNDSIKNKLYIDFLIIISYLFKAFYIIEVALERVFFKK